MGYCTDHLATLAEHNGISYVKSKNVMKLSKTAMISPKKIYLMMSAAKGFFKITRLRSHKILHPNIAHPL
jgi:hypothetical protein